MRAGTLIQELESAISSGSADRRVETLRRITALFLRSSDYTNDQIDVFDDVFIRLVNSLESQARAELAGRLAPIATGPARTIRKLAFDQDALVAGPILTHSSQLSDDDLIQAARGGGQDHMLAISQRRSLSESITDILVECGDQHVVRSVARNDGARFSETGFGELVKKSKVDSQLAEHVGSRKDIPVQHLRTIISNATAEVQRKLVAAHPNAGGEIRKVLQDIVGKLDHQAKPRDYEAAKLRVQNLTRSRSLGEPDIQAFARTGSFEDMVVGLSKLCKIPLEAAERALLNSCPDEALMLLKSLNYSWATARGVIQIAGGQLPAGELDAAATAYAELRASTAQRMLRFVQVSGSQTKA